MLLFTSSVLYLKVHKFIPINVHVYFIDIYIYMCVLVQRLPAIAAAVVPVVHVDDDIGIMLKVNSCLVPVLH
jgi:hypothetical protein